MTMKYREKKGLFSLQLQHRLHEALFILTTAIALFLLVALMSHSPDDPSWSSTGLSSRPIVNWGGRVGAHCADIFLSLFGLIAYFLPFYLIVFGWLHHIKTCDITKREMPPWPYRWVGWLLSLIGLCGLSSNLITHHLQSFTSSGGMIGDLINQLLTHFFNPTGALILLITVFLLGVTLLTGMSWIVLIEMIGEYASSLAFLLKEKIMVKIQDNRIKQKVPVKISEPLLAKAKRETLLIDEVVLPTLPQSNPHHLISKPSHASHTLPQSTLLNASPTVNEAPFTDVTFEELSHNVEARLADFGVDAKVVQVLPGPVITRFELDLAPGVKVSKISGLAKDIARSLSVVSVRVVEVIPGKSVIGLEIPNQNREWVTLRDLLESQRYTQSRSPVSLALGKDISGNAVIVDLNKMPHLLVAGTTGSGKSVSLNAMLLSMLFKATPEQLRFILIDPKMLELSIYEGIPHLLTPVITDMKDAGNALKWCVVEMDRRYRLMASLGVRHLAGYNQKVADAIKAGHPIPMPHVLVVDEVTAKETLSPLPLIVVVVDELADMMMLVGKKVEEFIARIAQKARAAGIHLILATQRPSVDVITGLIKANIPTRISFQVSSRIDSRTILDQQGAEQLIGHGDMLYLPPGAGVPIRVHGAYVADEEVHRVVAYLRGMGEPTYLHEVTQEQNETGDNPMDEGEDDPLYVEAVQIVMESRRASISLIQRRLRIGYNRAARIMETMEKRGLVSAMDHNGLRDVLGEESGL